MSSEVYKYWTLVVNKLLIQQKTRIPDTLYPLNTVLFLRHYHNLWFTSVLIQSLSDTHLLSFWSKIFSRYVMLTEKCFSHNIQNSIQLFSDILRNNYFCFNWILENLSNKLNEVWLRSHPKKVFLKQIASEMTDLKVTVSPHTFNTSKVIPLKIFRILNSTSDMSENHSFPE